MKSSYFMLGVFVTDTWSRWRQPK